MGTATTSFSQVKLTLSDISIQRGERLLISHLGLEFCSPGLIWLGGENGVGKTTLLRVIAGLTRPVAGQVIIETSGQHIAAEHAVAFMPSRPPLKPKLTTSEALAHHAALHQVSAGNLLARVGLTAQTDTACGKLSTGQAKRLSLAMTLCADRPVWLLDEPLAGLDASGRTLVAELLRTHIHCGGLALIASHAPMRLDGVDVQTLSLKTDSAA